jgi:hypothetical protein
MKYTNEYEVKRELGIESWRNLSKGKIMKFAAMMPDMDREVALKIVQQFPAFTKFALDIVDAMGKAHEKTLVANKQSTDQVYQALQDTREILKGELDKDGLSPEQKEKILDRLMELARITSQKNTEDKQFLAEALNKVGLVAVAAVALAVAFVGGKLMAESEDRPEASSDDPDSSLEA